MTDHTFADRARAVGVQLDAEQVARFAAYRDMILTAADRFNLTAVRDPVEIERRHFLESLALGVELKRAGAMPAGPLRTLDIGTGAGLPGLPVKIAWPEVKMTLLDANEKRCRFLGEAIDALGLSGVRVLEGRAEAFGRDPAERESYDLALARAVAPLAVLLEYSLPLVGVGGVLAAPKGSAAPREVDEARAALEALGGEIRGTLPFRPPNGSEQTLVLVAKVRPTPERFPRRPGMAAKRPIT